MQADQTIILLAVPDETTVDEASLLAAQLLSPDERERAARFVRREDRHDQIVTRSLVRLGLSSCFSVAATAWRFDRDERHKPFVTAPTGLPPFQFSLSHTRGLIALLVTSAAQAGVDLEHVERANDLPLVATRICAPTELESLNRIAGEQWRERFFQLWTLKEAYAKARGLGLSLPLRSVAFDITTDGKVAAHFGDKVGDDPAPWQFAVRRPTEHHVVAAAMRMERQVRFEIVLKPVRVGVLDGHAALQSAA